jgi:hypothetical protein
MNKTNLKEIFMGLQEQMYCKLSTNQKVLKHPVSKGDSTEVNWKEWFSTYLPKRYKADKAFIIDCDDNLSEQIDLVIYDQQYSPFAFNQDGEIYIPAESVYAVFEIKQVLNKKHIQYAGEKIESVRLLRRTSAQIPYAGGIYPPKKPFEIIGGIITQRSVWKESLGKGFEKYISDLSQNQRINIGCVLENGAFIIEYDKQASIIKSTKNEALIFFFLKLLIELQKRATVPAIDIECYAKALDSI